jgi:predicted nucleic-acid-binding protein
MSQSIVRPSMPVTVLKVGGDFADGLIAYKGSWLGGNTFLSFDKTAVAVIAKQGQEARLLAQ